MRDVRLILPNMNRPQPTVSHGRGIYLYDTEGKRYLDGCSGAVVANLGHGLPEVVQVMAEQAAKLSFSYRMQFVNEPALRLAEAISAFAPGDLNYSFFVNSGSEATELAMKLSQQYWVEKGKPQKKWIVSRWTSYHGSTMGALSMTGNVGRRRNYSTMLHQYPGTSPPYCYHCPVEKSYPECGLFCARELETVLHRQGPDNVAAFIAEPMIGASGAAISPPPDYFKVIREVCDRNQILLIADEVMTGFGRTGRNFGIEHWGVIPDIIAFGKGVSSGYTPLAGAVVREPVYRAFQEGSGTFTMGHTYSGNPLSCAVGHRVLTYIREHDLVQRAADLGEVLGRGLGELAGRHPVIGDVRGKGLFWGLELVAEQATRRPYPFEANVAGKLVERAFGAGLLIYPSRGALDGVAADAVIVAPPLTSSPAELDELLQLLDRALTDLETEVKALRKSSGTEGGVGR